MNRAAGSHNGSASHTHSRKNENIGCNPCFRINEDGCFTHVESRAPHIGASGAKVGVLGNHNVVADMNFAEAVQANVMPNPGKVSNRHLPGISNFYCWADQRALTNSAAKQAKQK